MKNILSNFEEYVFSSGSYPKYCDTLLIFKVLDTHFFHPGPQLVGAEILGTENICLPKETS